MVPHVWNGHMSALTIHLSSEEEELGIEAEIKVPGDELVEMCFMHFDVFFVPSILFLRLSLMLFHDALMFLDEHLDLKRKQQKKSCLFSVSCSSPSLVCQSTNLIELFLCVIHIHSFVFFYCVMRHFIEVKGRHLNPS